MYCRCCKCAISYKKWAFYYNTNVWTRAAQYITHFPHHIFVSNRLKWKFCTLFFLFSWIIITSLYRQNHTVIHVCVRCIEYNIKFSIFICILLLLFIILFFIWGACAINFIPHHNTLQFRRLLQAPTSTPEVDVTWYTNYIFVYMNLPVYRLSSLVSPLLSHNLHDNLWDSINIFSKQKKEATLKRKKNRFYLTYS